MPTPLSQSLAYYILCTTLSCKNDEIITRLLAASCSFLFIIHFIEINRYRIV